MFFKRAKREFLSQEQKKLRNKDRFYLVLSGIFMGLSFPPFPFPFQMLMFAGLLPLIIVVEKKEKLIEVNRAVYLFGFVFSLITLYWVGSWQKEADPFLMISGILLVFVNPVFFMIASTLLYFSRRIIPRKFTLYLFPLFWITYEYLYMLTDASFPWLTLGGGLSEFLSFIQIADIIGTLGLSLLVLYINVLLYKSLINSNRTGPGFYIPLSAALVLFIVPLVYGYVIVSNYQLAGKTVKVGIIQPNLDPWDKWSGGNLDEITDLHLNLSREAIEKGAEIIFWPETALPVYLFGGNYPEIINKITSFITEQNVYLLTGMPHVNFYTKEDSVPEDAKYSEQSGYYYTTYNSILLLAPGKGLVQKYGKMKLVPFGERVPFADVIPFLGKAIKWGVGLSGWNIGRDTTIFKVVIHNDNTLNINGLVCYESIYPIFITNFIEKDADLISILTNDSWYGNSSGPYQHKEYAVLRAVENRKSVIRAANGGISTIINPLGETESETKMFTRTVLVGDVILQDGKTFFTKHSRVLPMTAAYFSLIVTILFFLIKFVKRKNN